mmetsp:Transcript_10787/g.23007  ORF Transcript_10787/g.23007 Transcript_10787/m.23007 type:complete len:267 (+) Transcript_10787:852-1652(+)
MRRREITGPNEVVVGFWYSNTTIVVVVVAVTEIRVQGAFDAVRRRSNDNGVVEPIHNVREPMQVVFLDVNTVCPGANGDRHQIAGTHHSKGSGGTGTIALLLPLFRGEFDEFFGQDAGSVQDFSAMVFVIVVVVRQRQADAYQIYLAGRHGLPNGPKGAFRVFLRIAGIGFRNDRQEGPMGGGGGGKERIGIHNTSGSIGVASNPCRGVSQSRRGIASPSPATAKPSSVTIAIAPTKRRRRRGHRGGNFPRAAGLGTDPPTANKEQ